MGGAAGGQPDGGATEVTLLDPADQTSFRQRWSDAQTRFVDDPQEAVRTADGLVAELMQSLARGFSEHKARLEAQWRGRPRHGGVAPGAPAVPVLLHPAAVDMNRRRIGRRRSPR
jgi:hypothetical protein